MGGSANRGPLSDETRAAAESRFQTKGATMKFWAYRHIDGGIHVKAYRGDLPNARAAVDDAYDSDFVEDVLEPFPADSRGEAEQIAKLALDNLREPSRI